MVGVDWPTKLAQKYTRINDVMWTHRRMWDEHVGVLLLKHGFFCRVDGAFTRFLSLCPWCNSFPGHHQLVAFSLDSLNHCCVTFVSRFSVPVIHSFQLSDRSVLLFYYTHLQPQPVACYHLPRLPRSFLLFSFPQTVLIPKLLLTRKGDFYVIWI